MDDAEYEAAKARRLERARQRKLLAAQVAAAQYVQKLLRAKLAKRRYKKLLQAQHLYHDCVAAMMRGKYRGVKYAAILDRKTGKVLARSADIAFPDEYKVSKTERNAWQLIRIAGAKPKDKSRVFPKAGWQLLVRGKLTTLSLLKFKPTSSDKYFRLYSDDAVVMGNNSYDGAAAQATDKFVIFGFVDRKQAVSEAALEVAWMCHHLSETLKA